VALCTAALFALAEAGPARRPTRAAPTQRAVRAPLSAEPGFPQSQGWRKIASYIVDGPVPWTSGRPVGEPLNLLSGKCSIRPGAGRLRRTPSPAVPSCSIIRRCRGSSSQLSTTCSRLGPRSDPFSPGHSTMPSPQPHGAPALDPMNLAAVAPLSPASSAGAFRKNRRPDALQPSAVEQLPSRGRPGALMEQGRHSMDVQFAAEDGFRDRERMPRHAFLRTLGQEPQVVRRTPEPAGGCACAKMSPESLVGCDISSSGRNLDRPLEAIKPFEKVHPEMSGPFRS